MRRNATRREERENPSSGSPSDSDEKRGDFDGAFRCMYFYHERCNWLYGKTRLRYRGKGNRL